MATIRMKNPKNILLIRIFSLVITILLIILITGLYILILMLYLGTNFLLVQFFILSGHNQEETGNMRVRLILKGK